MSKKCIGCEHYFPHKFVLIWGWKCSIHERDEPFPGKGCDDFKATEKRYEKYVHKEG